MLAAILIAIVLIVVCYVSFLVFCLVNFRRNGFPEVEDTEHITRHGEAQDRGDFDYHT